LIAKARLLQKEFCGSGSSQSHSKSIHCLNYNNSILTQVALVQYFRPDLDKGKRIQHYRMQTLRNDFSMNYLIVFFSETFDSFTQDTLEGAPAGKLLFQGKIPSVRLLKTTNKKILP
jgi:hypothetical protein